MALRLTSDATSLFENGTAAGNVLKNDSGAIRVTQLKAGSGTYAVVASDGITLRGAYGVLTIMPNGSYTYSASAADRLAKGSTASDTFTYTAVNSSGASASTTLKFSLTGINDAPTLTSTTTALTIITEDQTANGGQTISSFLNSTDVDSSAMRGIAITGHASGNGEWQFSTNGGKNWSAVGAVADSAARLLRSSDLIRFVPDGISGTAAQFTYRAWDQTSGQAGAMASALAVGGETAFSNATAMASIAVTSVNDAPVAISSGAATEEDGSLVIGQLAATDVDGPILGYSLVANSSVGGTASIDSTTGAYVFTPATNFNGTASFKFTANDGSLASAPAAITIEVSPINDAPAASADSATTAAGIPILINVLANDSDLDGHALTLDTVDPAANGTVQIENGQVRYAPTPGFIGIDSFFYTIADSLGATSGALVTVAVSAGSDPVTIVLAQDYGYGEYQVTGLPAYSTIDAAAATWIVDNSRNDHPDATNPATMGSGLLNKYPFRVDSAGPGLLIKGGTIWGQVPQLSDWEFTYNNSAALRVQAAPGVTIDDWRIDKAWDAIRIANGSTDFLIDDAYVTDARDDAVENDYVMGGTIRDSLFDGVFSGISLGDSAHYDGSAHTLTLEAVFMRNKEYLYHGAITHVSPFKTDTGAPQTTPGIRIINSVIAVENPNHESQARLRLAWDNVVESQGNLFLNLSDTPLPSTYPLPPTGFTILQGQQARDYWQAARTAWLENHDGLDDLGVTPLPPIPDVFAPSQASFDSSKYDFYVG